MNRCASLTKDLANICSLETSKFYDSQLFQVLDNIEHGWIFKFEADHINYYLEPHNSFIFRAY